MIVSSLFWFAFACLVAMIEIEAEGKFGWAEKMPTWYRTRGVAARLYGLLMSGKPLTGYHACMFLFPVFVFHAHFAMGAPWSWQEECRAWALYFLWCPLWDFLWFVLNPHYGIGRFSKRTVWWHAKSIWIFGAVPSDYLVGSVVSFGLAFLAGPDALWDHANRFTVFAIGVASVMVAAPAYHRWYRWMRTRDDRERAAIFHDAAEKGGADAD